jgi:hypothetical protein
VLPERRDRLFYLGRGKWRQRPDIIRCEVLGVIARASGYSANFSATIPFASCHRSLRTRHTN